MAKKSKAAVDAKTERPTEARAGGGFWAGFAPEDVLALALAFSVILVYARVLGYGFIRFDDPEYVAGNMYIQQGVKLEAIKWAFTTDRMGHWHPLTWISYLIDVEFWGMNAGGFHFTNLVLHVANSVLILMLLHRMTERLDYSLAVASLFALHPQRVQAVVWIASRKDLLSAFFGILAVWCYFSYARDGRHKILTVLFMLLGVMSKSILMVLPVLFLILDYWPLQRLKPEATARAFFERLWPLLREKAVFFLISVVTVVIAIKFDSPGKALSALSESSPYAILDTSIGVAAQHAVYNYGRYLFQAFYPVDLSIYYPFIKYPPVWRPLVALLLLVVVSMVGLLGARRRPWFLAGWLWFLVALLPVSRLVLSDRYTYIAHLGLYVAIVWTLHPLLAKLSRWAPVAALLLVLSGCVYQSWIEVAYWRDTTVLFERSIELDSRNPTMTFALANEYAARGELEKALHYYARTLELNDRFAVVYANQADALLAAGRLDEAERGYKRALELDGSLTTVLINYAGLMARQGRLDEAEQLLLKAQALDAQKVEVHFNLGEVALRRGDLKSAERHFLNALKIAPDLEAAKQQLDAISNRK